MAHLQKLESHFFFDQKKKKNNIFYKIQFNLKNYNNINNLNYLTLQLVIYKTKLVFK